jgi:V/A-type H+-transporting ATPase subunit G/H
MINNIICQIKKAEKKAEKVIASSKKKSKEIIEDSYRRATEILKEAEKEAKAMSAKAEDEAKGDAAGEAAKLEKEYKNRLVQIKGISETNREKAIKKIVQRIIG